MQKKSKLEKYVELFKRNIRKFQAPGIEIKSVIYPVKSQGAVIEFFLNKELDSTIEFKALKNTVGEVLSEVPQRLVAGDISNIQFGGTNIYLEGNRLLIIKGEDDLNSWNGAAVIEDVERVVSTSQGGRPA